MSEDATRSGRGPREASGEPALSESSDAAGGLTHIDDSGAARMVDVSEKRHTQRRAIASGRIRMAAAPFDRIVAGDAPKGDVLGVARIAGIQGGKRTGELIPLCHVLPGASVSVTLEPDRSLPGIVVRAEATVTGQTGVEMEALTAASIALLTVYDMAKALDREMVIEEVRLERKEGGRSGVWERVSGTEGAAPDARPPGARGPATQR